MLKHNPAYSIVIRIAPAFLLVLFCALSFYPHPAHAGSGITVPIPASNIIPTLDGVCDPSEYSDAAQVSITVGTNPAFPIFMKRTADDAYFCFGDASGLPLANGGLPQVAIYIDRTDDGSFSVGDDFGVWMPYDPEGVPWARYWNGSNYNGADPGGWQAVKHQTATPDFWQVEFRISRQTIGGWNHTVGLALFYHWWRWQGDDYSWANVVWAGPALWGNGQFTPDANQLYLPALSR